MSPETIEILKALLATAGTLGVAALGLAGVIYSSRRPSRTKPPTGNTGKALDEFNGTQNEFMSLVIADNKTLRETMNGLEEKVTRALDEVSSVKRHQETFLGAVRRYLMKLATAWVGPDPMPWPDEGDFHILEITLPNRGSDNRKES